MLTVEGAALFDFPRSDGPANNACRAPAQSPPGAPASGSVPSLEEVERQHIVAVLTQANWRIEGDRGAAKLLNLQPSTLRSRMQKLALCGTRFRSHSQPRYHAASHGISWVHISWAWRGKTIADTIFQRSLTTVCTA